MDATSREDARRLIAHDGSPAPARGGRDRDLDDYRALALVWVMGIHCLYWPGLVGARWNVPKSLLLLEMPVLFFVAGASNGMGRARPAWSFLVSRLSRVLVPYWTFAAVCLIVGTVYDDSFARLNARYVFNWLVSYPTPQSPIAPIAWHLWFIPVYLVVMGVFPAVRALHDRLPTWARGAPLVVLAAGIFALDRLGGPRQFPRFVVFYAFWANLGLFYPRLKARPPASGIVLGASLAAYIVTAGLVWSGAYGADFQWNKLPPNFAFLMLGLGHLGLLGLAGRSILNLSRRPSLAWAIAPYRDYGFTIYLFHPFLFAELFFLLNRSRGLQQWVHDHPGVTLMLLFPAVVVLAPVVSRPFAALERLRVGTGGRPSVVGRPSRLREPAAAESVARG